MQVITTKKFLSHGEYPFFAVPGNHYEPKIWTSTKIFEGAVFFWTIPTVFLGNEKHLFSFMFMRYQAATATLCFLFENRQNKTPFLPGELWEEIKSLIYSKSNGGGSTERDRLGGASQY